MRATPALPGVGPSRNVLGLVYGEIARAAQAGESTPYRSRKGQAPTAIYRRWPERLEHPVREIQRTMRPQVIQGWLHRPNPAPEGETPRGMILKGRSETRLGILLSLHAGFSL